MKEILWRLKFSFIYLFLGIISTFIILFSPATWTTLFIRIMADLFLDNPKLRDEIDNTMVLKRNKQMAKKLAESITKQLDSAI